MEDKTKITYPESEKVYMQGQLHPYLKVGMRKVNLTPTVVVENGKKVMTENAPVYIYDTSGAYSDPNLKVDLKNASANRGYRNGKLNDYRKSVPNMERCVWRTKVSIPYALTISPCPIVQRKEKRLPKCIMPNRVSLPRKWNM